MYELKYINDNDMTFDFSPKNNIAISRTIGLTGNNTSFEENQSFNSVGTAIETVGTQSKEIEINGEILGDSLFLKKQMTQTISPLNRGRLYFNDLFFIDVIPVKTPVLEQYKNFAKFSIVLKAPYPFWRYREYTKVGLGYVIPRFRFPVNYSKPHRFGEVVVTKIQNVFVNGDIDSDINFTFESRGYVLNPKITNVYTQEFIKLNIEINENDIIKVYRDSSRLLRVELIQGTKTKDVFYSLDENSRLFKVEAGNNFLELSADKGENLLTITLEIYDVYLGVWDGLQRIQQRATPFINS